jgi:regulator of replication initiation timing
MTCKAWFDPFTRICFISVLMVAGTFSVQAQDPPPNAPAQPDSLNDALRELREQVRDLQNAVAEMRSEAARYHAESAELQKELAATRAQLAAQTFPSAAPREQASATPTMGGSAPSSAEDFQLLSAKVDDQYQTKVESASKYRVRLSGMLLLNLFANQGQFDNIDFPEFAQRVAPFDSGGSFGGTLRQSQIGLEVFGPDVFGAHTSANMQIDFAGGFPDTHSGVTGGLLRLRTATARLDWPKTTIVAGQDAPFFSPLSPTSFASVAVPALSYAGNLWTWIPQIRAERRVVLSDQSSLSLTGGILDGLSGETPLFQFDRVPGAGERSRQPGYGGRVAWTHQLKGRPMTVGGGGYYSRQSWGFSRNVDGWAATADWSVPLGSKFELSGELYRGRALGGLGGGVSSSIVSTGPLSDATSLVRGLNTVGGWSQLKFAPVSKLEFNGAYGQDGIFAQDLEGISPIQLASLTAARNRGWLFNAIYRPRSDLLFSAE